MSAATVPAPNSGDISLGNVPVVMDAVNNLVMISFGMAGVALHMSGAPVWSVVTSFAGTLAAGIVSAIHVSKTAWLASVLGAINAQANANVSTSANPSPSSPFPGQ